MAALISKPGLTGASALAIPKDWSQSWFRGVVDNLLKGADVRNATSPTGTIKIGGTIASPFGTLDIASPLSLTGPVTINPTAGQVTLTVIAASGQNAINVTAPAGQSAILSLAGNGVSSANGFNFTYASSGTGNISLAGAIVMRFSSGPTAIAALSPSGGLVDMTVDRNTFTLTGTGFAASVTSTATWYRIGNLVMLNIGTLSGTSNATTFTMTGLPAAITPNLTQTQPAFDMLDNGAGTVAAAQFVSGSSTITLQKSFGVTTAWTNVGTKGVNNSGGTTLYYLLN